ncbi:efflux RND transporter periplasmic adaptor subunit [Marinicella rhabdoformis]|uniref:efflux RND transporter periplasmic adaptor subunit n=1 Tax=Marinicella rhabdoformis TaxID=2580566 RepID=UPI001C552C46|nr:efflux RND transporter periplasmic adaptor subunit [Marinicella rhabdoformis]
MSKKVLMAFVVAFSSLLLSSCGGQANANKENKDKDKDKEKIVINVETTETMLGDAIATFKSTAVLEADRQATVTTKSSGIILEIKVEEGDLVKEGDVMMVLESDTQQLSLNSAKANYDKSLNNLKRAELMLKKGLTNTEQVDNLRFETKSLKASYDQAAMNLSFTQVKAPFDGMVAKRHVKIGNLIQNATAVFDVVDFDSLQAKISVPEHHWLLMKKGLPVSFDFDAVQNMKIDGHVERIAPTIDSSSGTFQVTVAVDNKDHILRPGLFAKAEIIYDQRKDVVVVDKDAIIREDDMAFVYELDGEDGVKRTTVTLGYEMLDTVELTAGILASQTVVTTGKNNLTPDSTVKVINYN